MPTVGASLGPAFTFQVGKGANLVLVGTVYDRAGNVIDLTDYAVKLAAKRVVRKSNGLGQITNQSEVIFDLAGTVSGSTVSFAILPAYTAQPGIYVASLRLFSDGITGRAPDDAYTGTFIVDQGVVEVEP